LRKILVSSLTLTNGASKKVFCLLATLALVFAWTSVAQADDITDPDPVGFCAPPATVPACTTGTGIGKETIAVGSTSIGMEKNGSGTSSSPWYLLVAVPNYSGSAPTLSIAGFTEGSTVNSQSFTPTTAGDIYDLFPGLTGSNGSLNASNLFGSNEVAAFGSVPTSFDVFEYSFTGAFDSWTPYTITIGGSGLAAGTFLAGYGGSPPFTTPYTTAGLVGGTVVQTPEPGSLIFLGAGLLALAALAGRRSLTA
jgi:PEP-CTERM motif-containing protein